MSMHSTRPAVLGSTLFVGLLSITPVAAQANDADDQACSPLVSEAWSAVADVYHDPSFNGVDWNAARPGTGACSGTDPHTQIRHLLARLGDPAVRLVPEAAVPAFLAEVAGQPHAGVGLRELLSVDVDAETGLLTVITPTPDGPAARAGIRSGDVIESVDGTRTETMDLSRAMTLLRGPEGTSVRLRVRRSGRIQELMLRRERIAASPKPEMVVHRDADHPPVGYVRVADFSAGTANALEGALDAGATAGVEGLVLDLRDNPGGMVQELTAAAELFLDTGAMIARLRARRGSDTVLVTAEPAVNRMPVVVLMNRGTASAAEALAGALRASDRAVLVGERSVGKGLAHFATPLTDGSLVIVPSARLETPHGRDILDEGILPDIDSPAASRYPRPTNLAADSVFATALALLRK